MCFYMQYVLFMWLSYAIFDSEMYAALGVQDNFPHKDNKKCIVSRHIISWSFI